MEQQSKIRPQVTSTKSPSSKLFSKQSIPTKKRLIMMVGLVILAVVVVFLLVRAMNDKQTGTYEDTNSKATASFALDVDFKRDCTDQKNCDPNKPVYDFKLFVFDKQGMQVRVVRADDKGVFKASLPEGDYILVTAKTFEGRQGLPQETVSLKNGKLLKLKVDYGTALSTKTKKE